jgi:phenylalanyl-tRNA synthetase beta chain
VLFELELAPLLIQQVPQYQELSKFPPVIRDLAFVVSQAVPAAELLAQIQDLQQTDSSLAPLQDVILFDEYRGKGLENKEKSLAFRFRMQDTRMTLSDAQADAAMAAVVARLAASHGARLRSA